MKRFSWLSRYWLWKLRQGLRLNRVPTRSVLDIVDFGWSQCVVLDVGACYGGFAGNILVRAPLCEVHCFEPNPHVLPDLRAAAEHFGSFCGKPRCLVNSVGVGSSVSRREFGVTRLIQASSFLPVSQVCCEGWPSADFRVVQRCEVEMIRLDNYLNSRGIKQVKLLKVDVQGLELQVLQGCGDRLRDIEQIVCEVQFVSLYEGAPLWHEIVSYAAGFNFQPVIMDGFCFSPDGTPLQADILLKRSA